MSSLVLLYLSAYIVSAMTVLLRVQVRGHAWKSRPRHVLAHPPTHPPTHPATVSCCAFSRPQLHILGKSIADLHAAAAAQAAPPVGGRVGTGTGTGTGAGDEEADASELFTALIEGTYKHMFGAGLAALKNELQTRVAETFAQVRLWTARI